MEKLFLCLTLFASTIIFAQPQVIRLYPGKAPGSEGWDWQEKETTLGTTRIVYNVVDPTITVYAPKPAVANGTAVVICPGGAFYALAIDKEGSQVAEWLAKKGVTAFVLKYRLFHTLSDNPVQEAMIKLKADPVKAMQDPVLGMGVADAQKAMEYVRSHAAEYLINPNHIGLMGFSAGGTVAMGVAYDHTATNRPDFVAPMYPFMTIYENKPVPADAPPIFVGAASNDELGLATHSVDLYRKWITAGKIAELHMYVKGGHGFGITDLDIPTASWPDRFWDWAGTMEMLPPDPAKQFRKESEERLRVDWAFFKRYDQENKQLAPPKPGENRVVFYGNSITEGWKRADPDFFAKKSYIDRGISGQTTPQMLVRFRRDVIDLKPKLVVILAGINDIAGNTGPSTLGMIMDNIVGMAQLAKANGIRVVLSSVLPAYDFPWKPGMEPAEKVIALNEMIKGYAVKNKIVYLDYFSAMADERKGLPNSLSGDGVHPNLAGYKIMEPLAEKAIAQALR